MSCICGKPDHTNDCCGALISGAQTARTAEELMRSRYTAYVQGAIDYLAETQHPHTADRFDEEAARNWSARAQWRGLRVVAVKDGGPADTEGVVEFIAHFAVEGQIQAHHERSRFRKLNGRWYYVDGNQPPATRQPRVGRNEQCPCGSGKKYKRCCGAG